MFKKMLVMLSVFLGCAGLFGFSKGVSAGTIKISNATYDAPTISASINYYGDGSNKYFDIDWYTPQTWSREDLRGNIIAVKDRGTLYTYYGRPGGDYAYYYGDLYDNSHTPRTPITKLKTTHTLVPGNDGHIIIRNDSGSSLSVGVSTWDKGDNGYYNIGNTRSENWVREDDPRGYLIYVKQNSQVGVYYAPSIGTYDVDSKGVKIWSTNTYLAFCYSYSV